MALTLAASSATSSMPAALSASLPVLYKSQLVEEVSKRGLQNLPFSYSDSGTLLSLLSFLPPSNRKICPISTGDAARSRKTVPLVIGDASARWTIAAPMVVWSCIAPRLWDSSVVGYAAPMILGAVVAMRALRMRTKREIRLPLGCGIYGLFRSICFRLSKPWRLI